MVVCQNGHTFYQYKLTSINSRKERILCIKSMMSRTAEESDDAQIRDDTESAYVKMFTTDMVTLKMK